LQQTSALSIVTFSPCHLVTLSSATRPTAQQLQDAHGKTVPDVIAPDLKVLFTGINPGLYSAAVGHHFARPGNRFWPSLYAAGFTPRRVSPFEERVLLDWGLGITNVVDRATSAADELTDEELQAGAKRLERKVRTYRPQVLAVLGVGAYRTGFGRAKAKLGPQQEMIGDTRVWVLPNPSGLNAHYQGQDLARLFQELRLSVDPPAK
jgi:TDG/mug DNA glycosylase family protein